MEKDTFSIKQKMMEAVNKKTDLGIPPLRPTPVPLCVMDIIMGTDHLKDKREWQTI